MDHAQPRDIPLEPVELVFVDDAVDGHAAVEHGEFLPGHAAGARGVGQVAEHAAHRRDSDAPREERDLRLVVAEQEGPVCALDLDLGADGQRVEGVLERGAGEAGGELDVVFGGRVRVAEVMVQRALGRVQGYGEPLPGLERVTGRTGEAIAAGVAAARDFLEERAPEGHGCHGTSDLPCAVCGCIAPQRSSASSAG